jgi:hypothetical protein
VNNKSKERDFNIAIFVKFLRKHFLCSSLFFRLLFSEDNSEIERYYDDHNGTESANEDQNKNEGDIDVVGDGERKSEFLTTFFYFVYLNLG